MRRFFIWIIDRWLLFSEWRRSRRDVVGALRETIERLNIERVREREALESTIAIREREIAQLLDVIERDRERVRAETAIHSANRETAGMRH